MGTAATCDSIFVQIASPLSQLVATPWFPLLQGGAQGGLSLFVGDSPSDLAALLAADVGIVVGGNSLLRRVASAAGVRLLPLVAGAPTHWSLS